MENKLLTTVKAAKQLGLSRRTVKRMIDRKVIKATNLNPDGQAVWRISQNEVNRLLEGKSTK